MFKETIIDFGVVKGGTTLPFLFEFSNTELVDKIYDVKAACGCTSTKVTSKGIEGILDVSKLPIHLTQKVSNKKITVYVKDENINYTITLTLKTVVK